jgi:hypothetical protein
MIRRFILASGLILLASPAAAQQADPWAGFSNPRTLTPRRTAGPISLEDLRSRVYLFSADSMEGRILGSRGNVMGTSYIAAELQRMGLEPAGENGTYFQTLPLVSRHLDLNGTISVGDRTFRGWDDFVPRDQGPGARSLDGVTAVWGGDFAVPADRLTPEQSRGKIVVMVFSGQVGANPPGIPNRGLVNRAYPEAAGIAIISRENIDAASLGEYQVPAEGVMFDGPPPAPTYLYITRPMGEALMGGPTTGLALGAAGRTVRGNVLWENRPSPFPARNVVAILRGSDPTLRNEYVAIGAHNDHVGMDDSPVAHDSMFVVNHLFRKQGADDPPVQRLTPEQATQVNSALAEIRRRTQGASARADSIYNGADDDASGSMGVLEIAERFASTRNRPKRSIIFVWHVGEEAGLFGSNWFTSHPTVPREAIVAQLNVDMIGRGGPGDITGATKEGAEIQGNDDYLQVIGSRRLSTQLGDLVELENREGRHNLRFDYALDANGHPQNIYCRSDHYEYAKFGIPIAFFTTGGHADYHQVTDEAQYIEFAHLVRVTKYIDALALRLANAPARPMVDQPVPDRNQPCRQ